MLQESYAKAFSKLDTLKEPEAFPGWLGMIVANEAKNALQKNNPLLFSEVRTQEDEDFIPDVRNVFRIPDYPQRCGQYPGIPAAFGV